ncbi:altronate dehydrogenase [Roseivivax marinus]|uniref:Altronate dehydrogenase n=1 Tax=Roseivivax marinus TaxID=1379903 RepID=W4HNS6_9RHOB|nr:D-mannonate oxidoreductase [Roseivivax marinus]ETW14078.1 altronate dehydrogenase [Roseivivax marinus]UMA63651.1 mannitol dehydrogenase family protein [Roseivivax marinus]
MSETTPILQFGTSRFLQAHADLFFHEGTPARAVTVVQSSGDPERARRLAHLAEGYPVRIRGISEGKTIDEERHVTSVRRTLSTAADHAEIERVMIEEAEAVVSNTGDRGFEPADADTGPVFDQAMSYPAKLYHLLAARHAAGGKPLDIFPLELINGNGDVLKARVREIAAGQGALPELIGWLDRCRWVNSLVDRIVSEPIEPAGAVAEPYALWAIEAQPNVAAPTGHPSVIVVDDLEEIERLKLHILNLGHTALVHLWQAQGGDDRLCVDKALAGELGDALLAILEDEVMPGFAVRGMEDAARDYRDTTLDRFRNPFLHHRLSDIAQNHAQKVERRIGAFLDWVRAERPDFPAPRLDAIAGRNAGAVS